MNPQDEVSKCFLTSDDIELLDVNEHPENNSIYDPCSDCMRDFCVGCPYSDPDMYDYYKDFLSCMVDSRTF